MSPVLLDAGTRQRVEGYLALEMMASAPYTWFVYEDRDVAEAAHRYLISQEMCEFGPPFARIVLANERVIAAAAWLTGLELRDNRLRAAVGLARGGFFRNDTGLRPRIKAAAATLFDAKPHDLYLSRLSVAEGARGRGLGRQLLGECEAEARRRSCERVVLEVSPMHQPAMALYVSAGFAEIDIRRVRDPDTDRELCYHHLVKQL